MKVLTLFVAITLPFTAVYASEEAAIRFVPVPVVTPAKLFSDDEILRAIRTAESQDNPEEIGRQGERGAYQFRRRTWFQYTDAPFRAAHTDQAHEVASAHLNWLRSELVAAGYESSPYNLALCWNAGLSAVLRGRIPSSAVNYASRVASLTRDNRR